MKYGEFKKMMAEIRRAVNFYKTRYGWRYIPELIAFEFTPTSLPIENYIQMNRAIRNTVYKLLHPN